MNVSLEVSGRTATLEFLNDYNRWDGVEITPEEARALAADLIAFADSVDTEEKT